MQMRTRWRVGVVVVVCALGAASGRAGVRAASAAEKDGADEAREQQARQYFEVGKQAAQKGQYNVAIVAFEEAYRLAPRTSVVFALAYSYRQQWVIDRAPAKLKRAVGLFREYLDLPGNDKKAKAVEYLGELEPELAHIEAEQARAGKGPVVEAQLAHRTTLIVSTRVDGATIAFDGGAAADAPAVVVTTAGKHHVLVRAGGYRSEERDVIAIEDQTVSVDVPLAELPAQLSVSSDEDAHVAIDGRVLGRAGQALELPPGRHRVTVARRGRYAWERDLVLPRGGQLHVDAPLETTTQRRLALWFAGGAAGLLVAGGVSASVALSAQSDARAAGDRLDAGESLTPAQRDDYNAALDRRDGWRTGSLVLFGGALAAAATSAVLYFVDTPRVEERHTGASFAPVGGGGLLSWTGSF